MSQMEVYRELDACMLDNAVLTQNAFSAATAHEPLSDPMAAHHLKFLHAKHKCNTALSVLLSMFACQHLSLW